MILKYEEALQKADNQEWFKNFYKKEDLATDQEVDMINELVKQVGEEALFSYFAIDEDMVLQEEYVDDLVDYLNSLIASK